MKREFTDNGFIIDLSSVKSPARLIVELSAIMEHPDVKGKNICLKLGESDLRQSQLLSIKSLVEAMDAKMAFVDSASEKTRASAANLGIEVEDFSESQIPAIVCEPAEENPAASAENLSDSEEQKAAEEVKTVEVYANAPAVSFKTADGVDDVYNEETVRELTEVVPAEHFDGDFEAIAINEGLLKEEDAGKYILLDTGEVITEAEEESSVNTETLPTLYLNQNLRSGQTISYEGNIVIIGDAHQGSEIVADGDITVWGILGGIAHAGAKGNITAKVRALKLNAIQLRVAGLYARRNDTLNVPYVQKTNEFTPEEAQIENGKIVIYKKLRRD